MPSIEQPLRRADYVLLAGVCVILFSVPLFNGRTLTIHQTVHAENVREMRADGDWIVAHYGGRPWMERPPLPFWITAAVVDLVGDYPWAYRMAAFLMAVPCVLFVGWMASIGFGRRAGLCSGLILATMEEFFFFATAPESDIFLCTIVTSAIAVFVYLEFRRPTNGKDTSFVGPRPLGFIGFFALLGLTNLAKGPVFGNCLVGLTVTTYLLSTGDFTRLRRYVWLPGWCLFLLIALPWPIAAWWRYPEMIDLWASEYLGRLNGTLLREPLWYYFAQLPVVLFPWTVPAFYGIWLTRAEALARRASFERFLWCSAGVPVLFLSIPAGKHHQYLLPMLAPWAILGAIASIELWEQARQSSWLRARWGDPDARIAFGTVLLLLVVTYGAVYACQTAYFDGHRHDLAFVREVSAIIPADKPLLVMDDDAPLTASWLLFYLGKRATLLHNVTFLLDAQRVPSPEVYLVARAKTASALAQFGSYDVLLRSERSRYENTPADRYALFRVRLRSDLPRRAGAPISVMQATGRAPGPYLTTASDQWGKD